MFVVGLLAAVAGQACAATPPADSAQSKAEAARLNALPAVAPPHGLHVDRSGRGQRGKASIYAHRFNNKRMADGRRMNPDANIAASKSLPLGSVARLTNLDNGKSATVKVQDRGPFVNGRVMDVTPKVAAVLDFRARGVVPVEVKPITVPQLDGAIKLGAGAAEASPRDLRQAKEVTEELVRPKATGRP